MMTAAELHAAMSGLVDVIRIRPARRSLISYAVQNGERRLGLDPAIVADPECTLVLHRWLSSRGRNRQGLRELLDRAWRGRPEEPVMDLPPVGDRIDLEARLSAIHRANYSSIPVPSIQWGRSRRGRLRSIRFGSYDRRKRSITMNPRLARPWVASVFLDAVIHHEFCHHRQGCSPIRGEAVHSPRFRAWDREFPGFTEAAAWLRASLSRLLDDAPG